LKKLAILGSTGSIGQSTLSIVEQFPERYSVAALAAGRNLDEAFSQASRWRPKVVSVATEELAADLTARLHKAGISAIEVVYGTEGTIACSTLPEADFVVSAIVGVAGLEATHAAILAGKPVGLANKECMVAAGEILTAASRGRNVPILPIDRRAQRSPPMHARGAHAEVKNHLADCIRWTLSPHTTRAVCLHHPRTGAEAPDLGDGPAHYDRFGDHAQQGPRNHRSLPPVRRSAQQGASHGAPAVHRPLPG
jgi:hypothetical protein